MRRSEPRVTLGDNALGDHLRGRDGALHDDLAYRLLHHHATAYPARPVEGSGRRRHGGCKQDEDDDHGEGHAGGVPLIGGPLTGFYGDGVADGLGVGSALVGDGDALEEGDSDGELDAVAPGEAVAGR